jgi:hypothetical protein
MSLPLLVHNNNKSWHDILKYNHTKNNPILHIECHPKVGNLTNSVSSEKKKLVLIISYALMYWMQTHVLREKFSTQWQDNNETCVLKAKEHIDVLCGQWTKVEVRLTGDGDRGLRAARANESRKLVLYVR